MIIEEPLPFVNKFVEDIDLSIQEHNPGQSMTRIQKNWIGFCVMAVLMTNTVCWAKFARTSLSRYSMAALCWMFRKSSIPWDTLLVASTITVLRRYNITEGVLAIDDTDKKRSKSTVKISKVHKIKDKGSGGFIMGQSLVFLVLITSTITIPVGFAFYMPDPKLTEWRKNDEALKNQGVPKSDKPEKPARDASYPTKAEIALNLLLEFKQDHPNIKISCILADALYGTKSFMDSASLIFGGIQVISQIRSNQNINYRGKEIQIEKFFARYGAVTQIITIRGGKKVVVTMASIRVHVCSHGKKRFVIALKYEGENEFRYIVASDMTWRTQDILEAYTLRWLVEVFFEDWKGYEGWGQLTKQTGEEGSNRSLILSLLVDHCLFFHPDQLAFLENNLPACTVGSLISKVQVECLLYFIEGIVFDEKPEEKIKQVAEILEKKVVILKPSSKHMMGRQLGRLEPSETLKYRKAA